ncbi:hypothetical protein ACOSQ2_008556 [Xanthoceras sorbifolium]
MIKCTAGAELKFNQKQSLFCSKYMASSGSVREQASNKGIWDHAYIMRKKLLELPYQICIENEEASKKACKLFSEMKKKNTFPETAIIIIAHVRREGGRQVKKIEPINLSKANCSSSMELLLFRSVMLGLHLGSERTHML